MATVGEVTARYGNFLIPVLAPRDGVCAICKRDVRPGWSGCYQCSVQRGTLSQAADAVAPIALSVKGSSGPMNCPARGTLLTRQCGQAWPLGWELSCGAGWMRMSHA